MDSGDLTEHEQVQVDLSGLDAAGIKFGSGLYATGEVTKILGGAKALVRLEMPIAGKNEIEVSADRLVGLGPADATVA